MIIFGVALFSNTATFYSPPKRMSEEENTTSKMTTILYLNL